MKAVEKKTSNRIQLYFGEDNNDLLQMIKKKAKTENRSESNQIISDLLKQYPVNRDLFSKKNK